MTQDQRRYRIDCIDSLKGGWDSDTELCHAVADYHLLTALREAGENDIADAWERAKARVGFLYS